MSPRLSNKNTTRKNRAKILDAGIRLFSERGVTGVSVDEIVLKAGCIKRMLYHYFGNKEGLYVAVLKNVFARLEELEMDFFKEIDDPEECLKRAAKAGHVRKGLNARHLLIQLYSVPFIYESNQHTLTHTLGLDLHDPKRRRRGVAQATSVLLHGLLSD